jgi:hypothetical protein
LLTNDPVTPESMAVLPPTEEVDGGLPPTEELNEWW